MPPVQAFAHATWPVTTPRPAGRRRIVVQLRRNQVVSLQSIVDTLRKRCRHHYSEPTHIWPAIDRPDYAQAYGSVTGHRRDDRHRGRATPRSGKDGQMSARHYRKVAALALVTTVGLSLAACCSSKAPATVNGGKTTITVDCAPLKTDNGGKSLAPWNADIAAFEKIHPDVAIESISVGAQCDTPADFTARLQGGTEADVFYGYMTDLQPGARRRPGGRHHDIREHQRRFRSGPSIIRPAQDAVHRRAARSTAFRTSRTRWVWSTTRPVHGRPASTRPSRRRRGRRSPPTPRRSREDRQGASATRTTAPATPVAGTSPLSSTRVAARTCRPTARRPRSTPRRAAAVLQNLHDMRVQRQQHGRQAAAARGRTC